MLPWRSAAWTDGASRFHTAASASFTWDAFVVQNFDYYYQSQAYLGVRSYQCANDDGNYGPLLAALTGVRVKSRRTATTGPSHLPLRK